MEKIITLGGISDYFPHWLDPSISVVFSEENLRSNFTPLENDENLNTADYTGPVSIHNVILTRARDRGFPVIGLWGHAPLYIHTGNFRVHLSLVNILTQFIGFKIDTNDLLESIEEMDKTISDLMKENPRLREFIKDLEEEYGHDTKRPSPPSLLGSDHPRGNVISINEFLKRDK